jgi:predicted nucleic acid-binding protein
VIILDTSVISEPLRRTTDNRVIAWLDKQVIETLYLTTISLAEVRLGIAALPSGARQRTLHERFEGEVLPLLAGRVLAFDEPASACYADICARARSQGKALGGFDALIAAIADAHQFQVATRDTAPFLAVRVPVIDPFASPDR